VNVSPIQFRVSDLCRVVGDALARSGLPANRLELEITEGTLMEDPKRADVISLLRERGVRVALDDFGTGYSALGYLQKFHIDKLKIDRSFIARLGEADDATIIVRTIVGLAHNLGLAVTAEGVETPEQLAMVREFMCEEVQGYLLGRPLPMGAPSQLSSARARQDFGRVNGAARRSPAATAPKAVVPGA
jgi:EAL domain-containing protein (putative c-di-GMP-specific phosphodiesterase class I)